MNVRILLTLLATPFSSLLLAADDPKPLGESPADSAIYDADPNHLWNRLFVAFYQRDVEDLNKGPSRRMGPDVLDPPLGIHPRFLLDDEPFAKGNAVLDEFLAAPAERSITDPLKRAVLQRDLWAIFDLLQTEEDDGGRNYGDSPKSFTAVQQEHRAILSSKVARCVAALALPRAKLEALPATYALAVQSGAFPVAAGGQAAADYLPADLFAENSPWLQASIGEKMYLHPRLVGGRSFFRIFYRPPADAEGAAKFAAWLVEQRKVQAAPEDPSGRKWEPLLRTVPAGTQFVLLREMIGIDDQWNLVPTHVVETVQVRVFRPAPPPPAVAGAIPTVEAQVRAAQQLFEEFDLDRRLLFRGLRGGLKATPAGAPRLMGYTALGRLSVDAEGRAVPPDPFPGNCLVCHSGAKFKHDNSAAVLRLQSLDQSVRLLPPPWPDTAAQVTIRWKAARPDFHRLRELAKAPLPAAGN